MIESINNAINLGHPYESDVQILKDLMILVIDGYEDTKNIQQMANKVKNKVPIINLPADVTTMDIEK